MPRRSSMQDAELRAAALATRETFETALAAVRERVNAGEFVPGTRIRLSKTMSEELRNSAHTAMVVSGTREAVPRHFGDNRGAWPIKLRTTSTFGNDAGRHLDNASPLWWQGDLFRVWCNDGDAANALIAGVQRYMLAKDAGDLRKSYKDVGPEFSVSRFERDCHNIGAALGLETRDDSAELHELRKRERRKLKAMGF